MTERHDGHDRGDSETGFLRALDGGRTGHGNAKPPSTILNLPLEGIDDSAKFDGMDAKDPLERRRAVVESRLAELIQEHRDLDDSINALSAGSHFDQLQIQRLKKRKLSLKDEIAKARSLLVPDIIA